MNYMGFKLGRGGLQIFGGVSRNKGMELSLLLGHGLQFGKKGCQNKRVEEGQPGKQNAEALLQGLAPCATLKVWSLVEGMGCWPGWVRSVSCKGHRGSVWRYP